MKHLCELEIDLADKKEMLFEAKLILPFSDSTWLLCNPTNQYVLEK